MIFKPHPLSTSQLEAYELETDRRSCRKIGPCGVGKKALYLNSFFIDRYYYVPVSSIKRVFKRVAMSKGGFSGKGAFASIPYLVVEFDGNVQKQFNFKHENQVDEILDVLSREQPHIGLVSEAAEAELRIQETEYESELYADQESTSHFHVDEAKLLNAIDYLENEPELYEALSNSARRRRAYQCSNPSYRWVAMAITMLGFAAIIMGIYSFMLHNGFAVYFTLFGIAAIFTFAGFSVLPTARNNRRSIMRSDEIARAKMEAYISEYPGFPVPARYAHPVVLRRMLRAIRQGRADCKEQALEVIKKDLKALNSDVQVSQEEYDEVVAIKAMFLNAMYN